MPNTPYPISIGRIFPIGVAIKAFAKRLYGRMTVKIHIIVLHDVGVLMLGRRLGPNI